jgi:hypothetical protein
LADQQQPPNRNPEMENETHRAGTVAGCTNCRDVVYEPGWYQMLRRIAEPDQPPSLHLVCGPDHPATASSDPSPDARTTGAPALATSGLRF